MKKHLLKSMLLSMLMVFGTLSTWAAGYTRTLTEELEVAGYLAKQFYNFQNNDPAVLPTSGDLRYRDGGVWGLHNFGSGTRSATATIPVAEGDIIVLQHYSNVYATINCGTLDESLSASAGYQVYKITTDAESVTFTIARYGGIVAALVMEKDENAQTAEYTLNYLYGEQTVKTVTASGAVGASVLTDASFFVDDVKYFRADGEPESFTIAASGNTFNVNVRLAATYNYSLSDNFGATVTSGSGLEGEIVYAPYPRYLLKDGKFYEAAVTNKEYRKPITLSENNISATVEYVEKEDVNAVFYVEGENVEGMTTNTTGNIPVRASNALAGVSTEDLTITTLPAGKYKFHAGIFTSKSSYGENTVNFGIGEQTFAAGFTGVNLNEIASDEFTLNAATEIKYLGTTSWADAQLDYLWIEKTGDVEVATDVYTVAGSPASLFGTAWDPTNTANDMTLNAETGLYEWSAKDAELSAGIVEFKVVVNHAWEEAYPSSNYEQPIAQNGTYDILITFNAETKAVNATATKTGGADPDPIEKLYIIGDATANGWTTTTEMTFNAETAAFEYTIEKDGDIYFAFGDAEFTDWDDFNANHRYAIGTDDKDATVGEAMQLVKVNGTLKLPAGKYNISVAKADLKCTITKVEPEVVLNTYTASFTTNAGWTEVYAYAWTTAGETTTEFLGVWPGTPLEKTGDVYTVTIKAEAAPAYIIFNNGGWGAQTADLAFEDGKAYEFKISDEWAAAINDAIAIVDENGIAVGKLIEAIAMAQGQTGTDEDKTALQAAVDQYKADNAPQETDLTSQFSALTNPSKWVNAIGAGTMAYAGWAAPKVHVNGAEVALVESYDQGQEFKLKTGDVMYQDIKGLTPGTYGIELFGAACLTEGRAGMTTDFAEGDDNSKIGACLYAQSGEQNVKEYIPCLIESNMNNRGGEEAIPTAKLNGIVVGADGTIRVGLAKELGLTNWHFVQLKGVTAQVLAKDLFDADQVELKALVAKAQTLAADPNKTEGKDALNDALTAAELGIDSQWYNIAEIETLINNLKAAIANFKKANWFIEFTAGEYYIIDAESGKKMAAGHNYGTRGIVNEMGLDLTLTPHTESRTVSIDSRVSQGGDNHFLGENLYMDSSEWGWALEYQGFGFYILEPNSEKYINIDENDNLVLSETPREFIIVAKDGVMEERMEELADATETNPVDATFLLQNPNFNRNDQRVSAWEWIPSETAEENADNWNNHNFNGGNGENNCAESYHAAFVVKQTVNGAPAGKYTMTAQGFYRQDTFEGDAPAAPMFFANGVNKDVPAKTGEENSMSNASESFTSGLYTIEPVEFEVEDDGMIYVGVTTAVHNQWVIFDNFQLKYYGKKDITDGISVIETEVLNGNVYNLQGQKVTKAQKGLFIVNGKKVVRK